MKATKLLVLDVQDDFPPGFFEALGRYAVEFGRLEYLIKVSVKSISKRTKESPSGLDSFEAGFAVAEQENTFSRVCKRRKRWRRNCPSPTVQRSWL